MSAYKELMEWSKKHGNIVEFWDSEYHKGRKCAQFHGGEDLLVFDEKGEFLWVE